MSADIITGLFTSHEPLPIERVTTPSRASIRALSPRHRRRMKSLAAEWGVSLETAVVIMVTAYLDAEKDA